MVFRKTRVIQINLNVLYIFILVFFFVTLLRLWYLQILKGEEYAKLAKNNRLRYYSIYPLRGKIKDRFGNILAEDKPAYDLAIIKEDCPNIKEVLKRLSGYVGVSYEDLYKKFISQRHKVKPFRPLILVPNVSFKTLSKIEMNLEKLKGVHVIIHPVRHYSYGPILAHVIGYVAQADLKDLKKNKNLELGDYIGKTGVEKQLNDLLSGKKGLKQVEVNVFERIIKEKVIKEPEPGKDLSLTIDLNLQKYAWDLLKGKCGAIVVMDAYTGDILALISRPSYDPNLFVKGISYKMWKKLTTDPFHPLQNRVIQSTFPPGSVFKLVVAGCALYYNRFSPYKKIFCPGFYVLGNRKFRCWKKWGHGWVNMKEAISQSCDVYFYKLGELLGIDLISEYAKKCGFGQLTGIDLPYEKKGLVPTKEWKLKRFKERWQKGETLVTAIGQGYLQVTPIQVARFTAAIVNHGKLLKPNLILGQKPLVQGIIPVRKNELKIIKNSMIMTVNSSHGTAHLIKLKGITIGAKTGTVQVTNKLYREKELKKIPYKLRDHAWMTSFAQKKNKAYVVTVFVEHGGMGSSAAGPIVKSIYRYIFKRFR